MTADLIARFAPVDGMLRGRFRDVQLLSAQRGRAESRRAFSLAKAPGFRAFLRRVPLSRCQTHIASRGDDKISRAFSAERRDVSRDDYRLRF